MNEYIIGQQSGELLRLDKNQLKDLLMVNLVEWNVDLSDFTFNDNNLSEILNILKKIRKGDIVISDNNVRGEVMEINNNMVTISSFYNGVYVLPMNRLKRLN